jgi:hypothetical protein
MKFQKKKLEIILSAELNVLKAYNLKFESDNNKWSFQLDLGNDEFPLNSNFIIDIIYEQKDATALCTFKKGNYLLCYPEIDKQNENDFFDISYKKKSGTVTYINSPDMLEFLIYAKMKFEKSYDLLYNEKGKWEFKIKVSECSIPKGRSIFLDVKIDYQSGLAKCSLNDDILLCEVISENQNEYNEIKLLNNKNNRILSPKEGNINCSKKISLGNISNLSESKFNNNHSFYERKSFSKDAPHEKKAQINQSNIIPTKKKEIIIRNNNDNKCLFKFNSNFSVNKINNYYQQKDNLFQRINSIKLNNFYKEEEKNDIRLKKGNNNIKHNAENLRDLKSIKENIDTNNINCLYNIKNDIKIRPETINNESKILKINDDDINFKNLNNINNYIL